MTEAAAERMKQYVNHQHEGVAMCATCKHYIQHYVWSSYERRYFAIHDGHCPVPRKKNRRPYDLCNCYTSQDKQNDLPPSGWYDTPPNRR